ncbi:sugar-phosphatase [Nocardiopsis mwathae]|uniref:Sugar-phosphatase n=1 Tax=Nocardiopsis mwathae TaxID=1472723 RepID=A0A7W9YLZ2_9ACTN|nr:HAD-IA family hydrolase [Nocardiopsis mwathae]MBB6174594.1 sugar-phosphatase [Nocardiopsis mwathae]
MARNGPFHAGTLHCQAVLFDLDGVLVDSMPLIHRVLRDWAAGHGLDPDHVVARSHGMRDVDLVRAVAPELDAAAEARRIARREEHDFTGIRPVAGAAELLAALPAHRWAIVTSGTRAVARGRLRASGLPRPRHLVAADDVARGKPAPDGYLRAAGLLGVEPGRCVVVEDAPGGARAAAAAGMACVGVGGAVPRTEVVRSLADLCGLVAVPEDGGLRLRFR